ncbi:hypothetical protein, partial [Nostoc sp.]
CNCIVGFHASTQLTSFGSKSYWMSSYFEKVSLIQRIASDEVIEQAFAWLCEKRQHYHYNADVWQVRRWWQEKKAVVQAQLLAGTYRFRELRLIRGKERVTEMCGSRWMHWC